MKHFLQALGAIVSRELFKFLRQYGRLTSALVRPLLWLAVFAAGFRSVFGVAIVEPYETYISYDVYIVPGLVGMVLLVGCWRRRSCHCCKLWYLLRSRVCWAQVYLGWVCIPCIYCWRLRALRSCWAR